MVMGPEAVPAVLLLATSVIKKKKKKAKIKNRRKEQHVFFLHPAELSRINLWVCFFLQMLSEAGEICWEPERSGQGCPAKRRLQPVLGTEERGIGPGVASGGVSSPGVRLQAARSAKPSLSGQHLKPFQQGKHRLSTPVPSKRPSQQQRGREAPAAPVMTQQILRKN